MANVALLVGFFVVPTALLALGHRLRERTALQRGAFWGGVMGHTAAVIVALVAMHWPPVVWTGGARVFVVFWVALIGAIGGGLIGALRSARR
jgi:hypothetical protein